MPQNFHKYKPRRSGPPSVFRLEFDLQGHPAPEPGRHQPNPEGCSIEIGIAGHVVVSGPSRSEVINHARLFLRQITKGGAEPVDLHWAT